VIVPARYGSSRFPGKPLALINNKPMVQHVYERAVEAGAAMVIIATDDVRIQTVAQGFGAQVCLTHSDHDSGTSRIAEVIQKHRIPADAIVVNVQGDEPFIPAENIRQVAKNLAANKTVPMATLAFPIASVDDMFNPNTVKVVVNKNRLAMYFSRSVIPYDRQAFMGQDTKNVMFENLQSQYLRHVGIYAYRAGFVKEYVEMDKTTLEQTESLEQLRVLWHGFNIHTDVAIKPPPHGVDTPEDLAKLNLV